MVSNILLNSYKTQEISIGEWEKVKNPSKPWLEKTTWFRCTELSQFLSNQS